MTTLLLSAALLTQQVDDLYARLSLEERVAQVYLKLGRTRLRAFGRISLDAGASARLVSRIPVESFAEWQGEAKGEWALRPGEYTVKIGASAWDTPVERTVRLDAGRRFPVRNVFFGSIEEIAKR